MVKQLFIVTIFLFYIQHLAAYELNYTDLARLTPDQLRTQLHQMTAENHHPITYRSAKWNLYNKVFIQQSERGSTFVKDVYCGEVRSSDRVLAPHKVSINIEHSWPRSKFNHSYEKAVQEADMYHLYITDREVNNQRANHPFGEVYGGSDAGQGDCPLSQIGLVNSRDYPVAGTQTFFQPPKQIRGDIARGLFYFAIRYEMHIPYVQEYFLKKWNHDDPVSKQELEKLQRVQEIQGNVNPFIINSGLADLISDF